MAAKKAAKKPAPSTKPLWAKLHIKGGEVLLVDAPAGFAEMLAGGPANVSSRAAAAGVVVSSVNDLGEVATRVPKLLKRMEADGKLWLAYRKGDKGLHRDTLWKAMEKLGLTGTTLIAADDTWSVMRFVRS